MADSDTPLNTDPKTGRTNVLVFGTQGYSMDDPKHDGGHLTDSMMVASINQDSGDVRMISLPRDLKVPTCTATGKLNEAYICEYQKNKGTMTGERAGARALAKHAENILGIKIQYFVHVNWRALEQMVNAVGGIDVAFVYQGTTWKGPEVAIETTHKSGLRDYWNRRTGKWFLDIKNGTVVHLDGAKALAVARARNAFGGYGAAGSNFSREQFQQKIIQALIVKARQTNFVTDWNAFIKIKDAVGDNLRMDFKAEELKTLLKLAGKIDVGGMKSIPLDNAGGGPGLLVAGSLQGSNGKWYSYVYPAAGVGNYAAIHAYVARVLSSNPVMSENASVVVMNATSVAGLAATEATKLKDKGYNVVQNTNAPSALSKTEGVQIYQKNKAMTGTAKALAKRYGVDVTTKIPDALTKVKADFVIILGNGYGAQ